jgi:integrase
MSQQLILDLFERLKEFAKQTSNPQHKKQITVLIKVLDEHQNEIKVSYGKAVLDISIYRKLAQRKAFNQYPQQASILTHNLVKKRIISNKTKPYPKDSKFNSPNRLTKPFLETYLPDYDKVMQLKDHIVKKMTQISGGNKLFYMYCYLRYFHYYPLPKESMYKISRNTLFHRNGHYFLVYGFNGYERFNPITICMLEPLIGKSINMYFKETKDITEHIDHLYEENDHSYEDRFKKLMNKLEITIHQIVNVIGLDIQMNKSPMMLTLLHSRLHPKIAADELNVLFPDLLPNTVLIPHRKNIEYYFGNIHEEEDDLDEPNIVDYLERGLDYYDELKLAVKFTDHQEVTDNQLIKMLSRINAINGDEEILPLIKDHLIFMIEKKLHGDVTKTKTLKEYIRIAFSYCYIHIVNEGVLNAKVIRKIDAAITSNRLTLQTQRRYKRIVNEFLQRSSHEKSLDRVQSLINIRRSYIFKEEFDQILELIKNEEVKKKQVLGSKKIAVAIKQVFLIFSYYGGFRKTELRSRRLIDVDFIGDNEIIINVSESSMKETMKSTGEKELSLKSNSAVRRVRFKISDNYHYGVVRDYLNILEKGKYKFLFPAMNESGTFAKKHVITNAFLDDLSEKVQTITKRYTPLHSLRHTYATNELIKILKGDQHDLFALYELSTKMGHADPGVTIDNYLHIEVALLMTMLE